MNEKKIPLSEAYVRTQRRSFRIVEIVFLAMFCIFGGICILLLFIKSWAAVFSVSILIVLVFLSAALSLMAEMYRKSLLERYELYKAMQHLGEGHGEGA